jgi:hypothetical protein
MEQKAKWRTCAEFPDYEVSDTGHIRRSINLRELKPYQAGHGAGPQVTLTLKVPGEPKKLKRRYLHRLVAAAWLEDFNPQRSVNFLDGDKRNSSHWNLTQVGDDVRTYDA